MARYDYQCDCGEIREVLHKIAEIDDIEIFCDKCHTKMTLKPSIPSLHFKGSGFYKTDNSISGQTEQYLKQERFQDKDILETAE